MNRHVDKTVVYIDGSALTAHPSGGIAHYAHEVCRQLTERTDLEVILLLFRGEKISKEIDGITTYHLPFPRRLYSLLWKYVWEVPINRFLPHRLVDVALYLNFAPSPTIKAGKVISFVHDLAYIHVPEVVESRNRSYLKKAVRRSANTSDVMGFPSQYTRDDFLSRYQFTGKTFVAYPGYTPPAIYRAITHKSIPENFLLTIGTIEPRKNVVALCEAYQQSSFYKGGWPLLVAGKKGWGDAALPDDPKIIHIDTPSDLERDYLLKHCRAFVFPSIFEGFGMPVVEAMYHEKPVVATNNSSLGEIVSQENSYVIPGPATSEYILDQLEILYSDIQDKQIVVESKVKAAHKTASSFTWDKCGQVFYKVIKPDRQ